MNKQLQRQAGKPAFDLIEEAVNLLRRVPLAVFASYYIGSLPFTLGLLYFWADMSKGAFAYEHVAEASLTMALLYVWMKGWQTVFASHLRALVSAAPPQRWSAARIVRMIAVQTALQPSALVVRPIAALITLPYGWAYAFYQNIVAGGDGGTSDVRVVFTRAARQAKLWPRQNHLALSVLTGFGIFVWANVAFAIATVPWLLKTFFGIETMFTKSSYSIFNSTFFAATCAGAYLCMNPIYHAFYVLRCFHGQSLRSGDDLRIELKSFTRAAALIFVSLTFFAGQSSVAENVSSAKSDVRPRIENASAPLRSSELNDSIEQVLNRREYTWRMPREKAPPSQKGIVGSFFDSILKMFKSSLKPLKHWLSRAMDWLGEWLRQRETSSSDKSWSGTAWLNSFRIVLYVLTGLIACALAFILWKRFRQRGTRAEILSEAIQAVPDLTAEDVMADELPEDGWLKLARELIERGDLRLALRAFYLAGLAHLGARELIAIAKYKSNRDYGRELHRRARTRDDLLVAFDQNMTSFERAWYGMHGVSQEILSRFAENLERIRAC